MDVCNISRKVLSFLRYWRSNIDRQNNDCGTIQSEPLRKYFVVVVIKCVAAIKAYPTLLQESGFELNQQRKMKKKELKNAAEFSQNPLGLMQVSSRVVS